MGKKTVIFLILGVVVLLLGIGGGVFVGFKFFSGGEKTAQKVLPPGPSVPLGSFTINLAVPEPHILQLGITLELENDKASELLAQAGWVSRLKNEVLLTVKDRRFEDLKHAEGVQALAQDLRGRMNALLPQVKGVVPIRQVLFEEFMLQ